MLPPPLTDCSKRPMSNRVNECKSKLVISARVIRVIDDECKFYFGTLRYPLIMCTILFTYIVIT